MHPEEDHTSGCAFCGEPVFAVCEKCGKASCIKHIDSIYDLDVKTAILDALKGIPSSSKATYLGCADCKAVFQRQNIKAFLSLLAIMAFASVFTVAVGIVLYTLKPRKK